MRTSIHVKYYRILFCRVKSGREEEAEMVVILTVRTLYKAELHLTCPVILKRIFSSEELAHEFSVRVTELHDARYIETAV